MTNRNTKLKPRELGIFFAFRDTRTLQSYVRFSSGSRLASFNRKAEISKNYSPKFVQPLGIIVKIKE